MPFNVAEPTATVLEKVVVPVAALVWVRAPDIAITLLKFVVPEFVIVNAVSPVASAEVPDP